MPSNRPMDARPPSRSVRPRPVVGHSLRVANDWRRLGQYVQTARVRAGMRSQEALAKKARVGTRTVSRLENGQKIGHNSLLAIEIVVGWMPGSAAGVLEGGEPVETIEREPRRVPSAIEDAEAEVVAVFERYKGDLKPEDGVRLMAALSAAMAKAVEASNETRDDHAE